ncbi:rRNA methyltransferase SpoU family protein [Moraxella bovoculi 237]|uniref:tRNA (cytidine/uridine-2'-O-)-methyltransferase TrmJ n=1 Tax=Moraxella bovoculi 237 TaxID=743974 RepID=A0A066UFA7_9GAMM|nr:RNA methyltransferase [Moraxella bovoculi]KDN25735.1 rRNA methyltransferase SpoU family protein [Moraxella bovoculi 237]
MNLISQLASIRIVMIGTTLPANIGSAARAMHTMGLSDLVVVNPRLPIDDTSVANAAGATSVLDSARIVNDLNEALSDCHMVFAASARVRHMPRPVIAPKMAAELMMNFHQAHNNPNEPIPKIAILFGREDRGLTNDELSLADYHIQIPANPEYPVLNVAAAVQVIGAFIYDALSNHASKSEDDLSQTHQLNLNIRQDWDEPAITHAQQQNLNSSLIDLLIKLDLADDQDLKHPPMRLSRLTSRVQLDQKEFALLRALIAKIHVKISQNQPD